MVVRFEKLALAFTSLVVALPKNADHKLVTINPREECDQSALEFTMTYQCYTDSDLSTNKMKEYVLQILDYEKQKTYHKAMNLHLKRVNQFYKNGKGKSSNLDSNHLKFQNDKSYLYDLEHELSETADILAQLELNLSEEDFDILNSVILGGRNLNQKRNSSKRSTKKSNNLNRNSKSKIGLKKNRSSRSKFSKNYSQTKAKSTGYDEPRSDWQKSSEYYAAYRIFTGLEELAHILFSCDLTQDLNIGQEQMCQYYKLETYGLSQIQNFQKVLPECDTLNATLKVWYKFILNSRKITNDMKSKLIKIIDIRRSECDIMKINYDY